MIEQVFTFKRTAALCLMGAFCSLNAQAQKITVKGSVVDGTGEPLIGATVKVKGDATSGVISDMDGIPDFCAFRKLIPNHYLYWYGISNHQGR